MTLPARYAEMERVSPDGIACCQWIESWREHDDCRHMNEHLVDPNEYVDEMEFNEEGSLGARSSPPPAVPQCSICSKIFASFKGLQQHAVIHTGRKPFCCNFCGKAFRFKSNLFEHRSVHGDFTPHACPYCGKTCRLKGNLKKHLKTHISTEDELEEAWKSFASNRRPPARIPDDAIIVRTEPFFTPPSQPRKRKLGLGSDARIWMDKIRKGELLPSATISEKVSALRLFLFYLPIRLTAPTFSVPLCLLREKVCLKTFANSKSMEQHESYHKRVHLLIEHGDLQIVDPVILRPETCGAVKEKVDIIS
ncbi:unnamed protein product [Toxocara canis]|uniref:Zinc finger protein n=1 Tax=Toxocara canis TaxID=6265 RepID=A0A183V5U3_TOXCA|nr:unnamed protein product [Toxocara canis]